MDRELKLGSEILHGDEALGLIRELGLLPLLIKKYLERKCAQGLRPTEDEQTVFFQAFLRKERIDSEEHLNMWLSQQGLGEPELSKTLFFALQLEQYKAKEYSGLVEGLFLERKSDLDQVMYSMIRTKERAKANEIFTRLNEEEDTFAELASEYSEGMEQELNGLIGPIPLGRINVNIAERLRVSQKGQLWEPFQEGEWWVLLRLERLIPAKLDDRMRSSLINELHEKKIKDKVTEILVENRLAEQKDGASEAKTKDTSKELVANQEPSKPSSIQSKIKGWIGRNLPDKND